MASVAELDVLIRYQQEGQGALDALNKNLIPAAIGIGALYEIGKSALDNSEAQAKAAADLAQAFQTQGESVPTAAIAEFLEMNRGFISDQYDAEKAIATATRAGIDWKDTQFLMQDALNLSIDRGISMSDAMDILTKAAAGGRVQLAYLGITSKELADQTNALANAQKEAVKADAEKATADRALQEELDRLHGKHTITQSDLDHLADLKAKDLAATQKDIQANKDLAAAQAENNAQGDRALVLHEDLNKKLTDQRTKVTELEQSQNKLNVDWQDFSGKYGPGVAHGLSDLAVAADNALGITQIWFDFLSNDTEPVFGALSASLINIIQLFQDLTNAVGGATSAVQGFFARNGGNPGGTFNPRASGAPPRSSSGNTSGTAPTGGVVKKLATQ